MRPAGSASWGWRVAQGKAEVKVYTTQPFAKARVVLTANGIPLYDHVGDLSPVEVLEASVPVDVPETALTLTVYAASGRMLLSYTPKEKKIRVHSRSHVPGQAAWRRS